MNAPVQHLPLEARLNRPLAPSLERQRLRLSLIMMVTDGLAIFVGFLLGGLIYFGDFPSTIALREATLITPLFLAFGFHGGMYSADLLFTIRKSFYISAYALIVSAACFFFVTFYAKNTAEFSRVIFTLGTFFGLALMLGARWLIRLWVVRVIGPSLQNTIIIHAGGPAVRMDNAFHVNAAEHNLSPDASDPANLDRLGRYMENMDRVIISCPHDDRDLWVPLLRSAGVTGEFVSDALRRLGALRIQNEAGFSSVVVSVRPLGVEARVIKRLMDVSLTSAALLILSPLMAIVGLLIRLEDGGPVLFRQRRMGAGNRFFWIYKFRSMRVEAGDSEAGRLTARNDDRTTRIGRFIRRTSIDELPQLFNVWRGDMSLVGPRPHALGALAGEKLYWEIDGRYWNRHVLKPGLTGLAQVRGFRGTTACEQDLADRLQADLEYISNWSMWLDIKIVIKTFNVLVHQNAY